MTSNRIMRCLKDVFISTRLIVMIIMAFFRINFTDGKVVAL